MLISELEAKLKNLREEHGDVPVVIGQGHEYWGTLHFHLNDYDIAFSTQANPDGPKKLNFIDAVIIDAY